MIFKLLNILSMERCHWKVLEWAPTQQELCLPLDAEFQIQNLSTASCKSPVAWVPPRVASVAGTFTLGEAPAPHCRSHPGHLRGAPEKTQEWPQLIRQAQTGSPYSQSCFAVRDGSAKNINPGKCVLMGSSLKQQQLFQDKIHMDTMALNKSLLIHRDFLKDSLFL